MPRSHLQDLSEAHLGGLRPARRAGAGRRAPSRALSRPPPERAVRTVRTTLRRTVLTTAAEAIGVTFLLRGGPATIHGPRVHNGFCELAEAQDGASAARPGCSALGVDADQLASTARASSTQSRARGGRPPGCCSIRTRAGATRTAGPGRRPPGGAPLHAGVVDPHVVRGPADPEVLAAGGQLPDEVGEPSVVGIPAGLGAQQATVSLATMSHSRKNDLACESRKTKRALFGVSPPVGVHRSEQRPAEAVRRHDAEASVRARAPGRRTSHRPAAGCWDAPWSPAGRRR